MYIHESTVQLHEVRDTPPCNGGVSLTKSLIKADFLENHSHGLVVVTAVISLFLLAMKSSLLFAVGMHHPSRHQTSGYSEEAARV